MPSPLPRYIVVEGPIGVGKTTLAEGLAKRLNGRLLLEQFEENPFLQKFYEDKERFAFQTELFFLLSRHRQQEAFIQEELFTQHTISDYYFEKCRMFANITLDDHELSMFDETYQILSRNIPRPDLVVHLLAPIDVLLERIASRGRSYETEMSPEYLEQLCAIYHQEFSRNVSFPVIHLDTTHIDFRDPENIMRLMHLIQQEEYGRIDPQAFLAISPPHSSDWVEQQHVL